MSRSGFVWEVSPTVLADALESHWQRTVDGLVQAFSRSAMDILAFARVNHPWRNRTGAAESGLNVVVEVSGDTLALHLAHAAPHGIWLETRWGGRWGVLDSALRFGVGRVMADMQNIMGG